MLVTSKITETDGATYVYHLWETTSTAVKG
jgi:hypothetical protein